MARLIRFLNLGAGGSAATFVADSAPGGNGQLGGVHEDNSQNRFQLWKWADGGSIAGDVVYAKTHDGSYTCTPTVANSSRNEAIGVAGATVLVTQVAMLQQGGVRAVKYTGTAALTVVRGALILPDSVGANSTDAALAGTAIILAGNQNVLPIGIAQAVNAGGFVSTFLTINPL